MPVVVPHWLNGYHQQQSHQHWPVCLCAYTASLPPVPIAAGRLLQLFARAQICLGLYTCSVATVPPPQHRGQAHQLPQSARMTTPWAVPQEQGVPTETRGPPDSLSPTDRLDHSHQQHGECKQPCIPYRMQHRLSPQAGSDPTKTRIQCERDAQPSLAPVVSCHPVSSCHPSCESFVRRRHT